MKKILNKLIIIGVIILVIIVGLIFFLSNREEKYKESITINIGDKIPKSNDYFEKDIKVKIKWSNLDKDSNYKVNTYDGTMTYKKHDYKVKLQVKDITPPEIKNVKDITITEGDKVDLWKDIKVSDDSKDELEKEISGKYDLKKKGTYNLKYVVKDKSNTTTKDFKLIIKEKPKEEESNDLKNNNDNNTSNNSSSTNRTSSKGYKVEKRNGIYYVNGILIANKSYPLPSNYNPGGLTQSFMTAYYAMKKEYDKQGFKSYPKLSIRSGFRSYSYQQSLYNNYVARDGKAAADRYSARPGHSEHQTGLAADLNVISNTYGNTDSGRWLANNCWRWGFILRYPKGKESQTGYMYESWHFRYLGNVNIAKSIYNNGSWSTLEEYLGITSRY